MPNVQNSWLCQVVDKSPNNKHINLIINYSTTEENIKSGWNTPPDVKHLLIACCLKKRVTRAETENDFLLTPGYKELQQKDVLVNRKAEL